MSAFQFKEDKAISAIVFVAAHGISDLTKGKLAKLLFLADKQHLVRHGRPITGDWYAALPHGPIPSNIDNLLDALEAGNAKYPGVSTLSECVHVDSRIESPR